MTDLAHAWMLLAGPFIIGLIGRPRGIPSRLTLLLLKRPHIPIIDAVIAIHIIRRRVVTIAIHIRRPMRARRVAKRPAPFNRYFKRLGKAGNFYIGIYEASGERNRSRGDTYNI